MMLNRIAGLTGIAAMAALPLLTGCRVESNKDGNGKDVNISTPFGGMQVHTNGAGVMAGIGLPQYPGAQLVKEDNGKKDNSADVNMNFGGFALRVQAVKFHTEDSAAKVEAFYRDGMKRYGDVIACHNQVVVNLSARTAEGLTCDNQKNGHWTVDEAADKRGLVLKAGSPQHQHLVTIDSGGAGTNFSLVALDLPSKINEEGSSEDTRQ